MKIRYPIIVSIVLFVSMLIVAGIFTMDSLATLILFFLWIFSLLWIVYAIIAKLCRTIYRAVKNRANRPEKSPLEP